MNTTLGEGTRRESASRKDVPDLALVNASLLEDARLALILVALLLVFIVMPGLARLPLFAILMGYAVYSVLQARTSSADHGKNPSSTIHWVDLACYLLLVSLSGGFASPFAPFLLFPILVAAYQGGFRSGIAVALTFAVLLVGLGTLPARLLAESVKYPFAFMPEVLLLVMAPVIAMWGHAEGVLMRRMALSSDLSRSFSLRHGLDRATCELAEILREYQRADACVVLVEDAKSTDWTQYQIGPGSALRASEGKRIAAYHAQPLLAIPPDHAVLYSRRLLRLRPYCRACDCATLESRPVDLRILSGLANLLEANSFISLPVRSRNQTIGRLHLVSRNRIYQPGDLRFLTQVVTQVGLMIENMRLVEQRVHEAAIQERRKISRDLHDDAIQPYIGLKLGLEALRRRLGPDEAAALEIDDLIGMANDGVGELRQYVGGLKSTVHVASRSALLPAVRRQADKFKAFYGIDTQVAADSDVVVGESLLDEVLHIVREGLSNIRRHTAAAHAAINIRTRDRRLVLEIINDNATDLNGASHFFPRSIGERAKDLGGRVAVEHRNGGRTVVAVEIPL